MNKSWKIVYVLVLCAGLTPLQASAQQACERLTHLKLPKSTITSAVNVGAGTLVLPPNPLGALSTASAPAFCRVKGTIRPTADSDIGFEVWMPSNDWDRKFVQVGNGGFAGSIDYMSMLGQLKDRHAVAATDDGHKGTGSDGSWALGHPERIKDFGYRAVHETSAVARKIIAAYYGSGPRYAYFDGCSEGGREALMEAQRFPRDFNGILVGSPGNYWTGLMAAFAWNAQALSNPQAYIPEVKRQLIEKAALEACGTQGGVTSDFIQYPLRCHFDPSVLLCKGKENNSCLTKPQLRALEKIYSGPKNPRTGAQISPGYEPGAEDEPGIPGISFASYIFGAAPGISLDAMFSSAFYGNFVFDNPQWKFTDLNFDTDISEAEAKVGAILNATNPNLGPFKSAGGKMVQYEGWNDGSPSPFDSVDYYKAVEGTMGGLAKTEDFYRLFMVPGMMHCGEGPGPNSFGNLLDPAPAPDAEHNIFVALQEWVEKGVAPRHLIATKYKGDNPAKGIELTRPLCPYPAVAMWKGKGSARKAKNWVCMDPHSKSERIAK